MSGVVLWKKQRKQIVQQNIFRSPRKSLTKSLLSSAAVRPPTLLTHTHTLSLTSHVLSIHPSSRPCCIATLQIYRNWPLDTCKYYSEILLELGHRTHFPPLGCVCFLFLFQYAQLLFMYLLLILLFFFRPNVVRITPIDKLIYNRAFWEILYLFECGM